MNYSVKFLEPTLSVCAEARRETGWRRSLWREMSSFSARTCGRTFGKNDPNRVHHGASPYVHRRIARRPSVMRAIEDGRNGALEIGRPIQPPMLLWRKPLDLRLEHGFDRPVRRLNGDHARPGIGDTARLADALDLRTLLREFASAQD